MDLRDRLLRGFIAGILAGIVLDVTNIVSFSFGITELSFLDWSSAFFFGFRPTSSLGVVFPVLLHLFFAGLAGVLFVYFLAGVKRGNPYLKGVLFSLAVWVSIGAVNQILTGKPVPPLDSGTLISNIVAITAYGLVLAFTTKWLDERFGLEKKKIGRE